MHVMIIGAGTGGLALAHGLKRAGIGVSVYERDVTPRDDQGGYRVGISPAGRRALKAYPSVLEAEDLLRMAQELTRGWHPNMRQLIRMTGPSAVRSINVRTSVPLSAWESSNVTLLGDAVHTMTPGRGAGANTALRDAALLSRFLDETYHGRKALVQGIREYEAEMLRYSTEAVLESRKQMNANDMIHKPSGGRLQLAAMRSAMRFINAVPPLKRRVIRNIMRVRGEN